LLSRGVIRMPFLAGGQEKKRGVLQVKKMWGGAKHQDGHSKALQGGYGKAAKREGDLPRHRPKPRAPRFLVCRGMRWGGPEKL